MSTDTDVERLRALVAELDQLLAGPSTFAAVDAGGFPAHVASGELIESAWGNAVVDAGRVGGGYASYPSTATIGGTTILTQTPLTLPYKTRMFVTANGWAGSNGGTMDGVNVTVQSPLGNYASPSGAQTPTNRFGLATATYSWVVPADGNPTFSLAVNWVTTGGGTTFVVADLTWNRYREP